MFLADCINRLKTKMVAYFFSNLVIDKIQLMVQMQASNINEVFLVNSFTKVHCKLRIDELGGISDNT